MDLHSFNPLADGKINFDDDWNDTELPAGISNVNSLVDDDEEEDDEEEEDDDDDDENATYRILRNEFSRRMMDGAVYTVVRTRIELVLLLLLL